MRKIEAQKSCGADLPKTLKCHVGKLHLEFMAFDSKAWILSSPPCCLPGNGICRAEKRRKGTLGGQNSVSKVWKWACKDEKERSWFNIHVVVEFEASCSQPFDLPLPCPSRIK